MKRFINAFMRRIGYEPIDYNKIEIQQATERWIKSFGIDVIFDVGASDGGFLRKIKATFPSAVIYSFEPLPESYNDLVKKQKHFKNFHPVNIALSDKIGETNFYRCENNTGSSSILEMTATHKEAYPYTALNSEIKIQTTTLDEYAKQIELFGKKIMLKIDVQGAEELVLNGALDTLRLVDLIFLEMNFTETYKDCTLMGDLTKMLGNHNFILCGIENVSQNVTSGEFLQCDAYFKRVSKYEK